MYRYREFLSPIVAERFIPRPKNTKRYFTPTHSTAGISGFHVKSFCFSRIRARIPVQHLVHNGTHLQCMISHRPSSPSLNHPDFSLSWWTSTRTSYRRRDNIELLSRVPRSKSKATLYPNRMLFSLVFEIPTLPTHHHLASSYSQ